MAVVKTLIGNIKGPKGEKGDKGDTGAKGDTGPKGEKGDIGTTGQRGSRWTQGTAITGTSTTATIFSNSGISDALVNDNYLNTSTGNTYKCTVAGNASTAKWVYSGNIKGAKGDTGPKGEKGDTGATGPKGPQGEYAAVDSVLSKTSTNPIQNKAAAEEFEKKLNSDGDSKDLTTTFTSGDSANATAWTDVGLLTSGEKHSSLFQKVATMFKNIRYLYHMLGTADISTLGEGADIGTVTGALSKLNSDCNAVKSIIIPSEYAYKNVGFVIRKIGQVKIIEIDGFDVTKINNVKERITIGSITDPEYYCHGTFVKDLFYVTSDGTRFKIRINLTNSTEIYLFITECTVDDLPKLWWSNICEELVYI